MGLGGLGTGLSGVRWPGDGVRRPGDRVKWRKVAWGWGWGQGPGDIPKLMRCVVLQSASLHSPQKVFPVMPRTAREDTPRGVRCGKQGGGAACMLFWTTCSLGDGRTWHPPPHTHTEQLPVIIKGCGYGSSVL